MRRALFAYTGLTEHPGVPNNDSRMPPIDRSRIRGDIPPPVDVVDLAAPPPIDRNLIRGDIPPPVDVVDLAAPPANSIPAPPALPAVPIPSPAKDPLAGKFY